MSPPNNLKTEKTPIFRNIVCCSYLDSPSSGMLRRVPLVKTDVSEERVYSETSVITRAMWLNFSDNGILHSLRVMQRRQKLLSLLSGSISYCDILQPTAVIANQRQVRHNSMDTFASSVLLRGYCCIATNSRTDGVFIGPARCCIEKKRHNRYQIRSVHFRQRVARDQFSARSELQETS
jgi:hypothetical protein